MFEGNFNLHPVFTAGRWTARILGSFLLLLLFVIMTASFFSEGLPYDLTPAENWMFFNQTINAGWVIPLFLIVGILDLMCWLKVRRIE